MKNKKIILAVLLILLLILMNFINKVSKVKYVFLFVGDGMSSNQIELTEIYNNVVNNKNYEIQDKLSFSNFPTIGIRKNYIKGSYVPDSASSATALSSGLLTGIGNINVDGEDKKNPITYDIKKQRHMKIGIISTSSINSATPAAFYAKGVNRNDKYDIATMLADSDFDYYGDGGFDLTDTEKDKIYKQLKNKDYKVVLNKKDINNKKDKVIFINPNNESGNVNYAIDGNDLPLSYFVKDGIKKLDNENGFFMMIESGLIDYAGHNNDIKSVISEVNVLDDSVKEALEFYEKHPNETLIIVTGDHETGGLSLGNDEGFGLFLEKLKYQKQSLSKLESFLKQSKGNNKNFKFILKYIDGNYGISYNNSKFLLNKDYENKLKEYYNNEKYAEFKNLIVSIISKETKVGWTSDNHTASLVTVYSKGVKSEIFGGNYSSVEFNKKLRKVMNLK